MFQHFKRRKFQIQASIVLLLLSLTIYFFFFKTFDSSTWKLDRQKFYNAENFQQATGWLKRKWISAKELWYKKFVTGEDDISEFRISKKKVGAANLSNEMLAQSSMEADFDYFFPEEDTFAYVWYASTQSQFCSALLAFKALKYWRSQLQKARRVDYILIFPGDGPVNNDNEIFLENVVEEKLVEKWLQEGGTIGGYNIAQNSSLRKDERKLRRNLKFSSFSLGYTWIVLLEPDGIPLKPLDILFDVMYGKTEFSMPNAQTLISGPRALTNKMTKAMKTFIEKSVNCFGRLSEPMSTALMVFQPHSWLIRRAGKSNKASNIHGSTFWKLKDQNANLQQSLKVQLATLEKIFPDMILINREFACNEEISLLPRNFARTDAEFLQQSPPLLTETYFLHFSMSTKPWQKSYQNRFFPKMDQGVVSLLKSWLNDARNTCGFSQQSEWVTPKPQSLNYYVSYY